MIVIDRLFEARYALGPAARRITYRFTDDTRAGADMDFAMGQLIYDLRTRAELSQRELAERMGTTQSVISRLEEGGGPRNRLDTLARVATALDRTSSCRSPRSYRND